MAPQSAKPPEDPHDSAQVALDTVYRLNGSGAALAYARDWRYEHRLAVAFTCPACAGSGWVVMASIRHGTKFGVQLEVENLVGCRLCDGEGTI